MLLLTIALSLPFVQTRIARYATNTLNEKYGTHIAIDKVAISITGNVKLKGVLVLDHHTDTLISATGLQTNVLSFKNIADSNLQFGTITADDLNFQMKTYKGETSSSLDVFVKAFDNGQPGSGKFRMKAAEINVANGRYRLINENNTTPRILDFQQLNGQLDDFYIKGSDVSAQIQKLALLDHRGLYVKNLTAGFSYTKTNIDLKELELVTAESALKGEVKLTYTREDMRDFVNKVRFDFQVDRAYVSSNELNYFYNEFGKNQKYYLSTTLTGPLNNFVLTNLKLLDAEQSEIIGTINFQHLFDREGPGFYMDGNFTRVSSNYNNLRNIMPRILGKSLPPVLGNLGNVDISGHVRLTKTELDAKVYLLSELGTAHTDLSIKKFNTPDDAVYKGTIDLDDFNLGQLLKQKSLGNATAHLDVDGKGFNQKSLNTVVKGDIKHLQFNKYNYSAIDIDGRFKWPYFKGVVNSNDPNLLMSFDGLVDMSKHRYNYDFHAQVDYADLALLNIITNDTLSIFKGDLLFEANGNDINDIAGTLQISSLSYQNSRDSYYFEDFFVHSSFDADNVRTISINSTDIVEGTFKGKFDVNELPKLAKNALGSLYTNYSPYKVKPGQYINFNLEIYNKIIEIVLPDVIVGQNTILKGHVNADKGEFRLSFDSPSLIAYNNHIYNIDLKVDSQNPLYSTYLSLDSLRTKKYKIAELSLINVKQSDTLHVHTEFKGGNAGEDSFDLDLYHTINEDNKSVVGFKKSEVNFKDHIWYINENNLKNNKLVFDEKLTDFTVDTLSLSHNDQKMQFMGVMRDSTYKDFKLKFNDVALDKITPSLDSLEFGGNITGEASLKQNKGEYRPSAALIIDSLRMNTYVLGNLELEVKGDELLHTFNVTSSIYKDDSETFYTRGTIEVENGDTNLSLDATLSNFDISPLTVFLKAVFPEMRGNASGRIAVEGNVRKPEIDGRFYLNDAGVKVGYLNTDFDFEQGATIDLTEDMIFFRNIELTDTRYKTKGRLNGKVEHDVFKDWALDLRIDSDRLLVLDTKDSDDALYYGTAFIKGFASIAGPVQALYIDVEAESESGTDIKIPINNTGAVGNSTYIHFLSPAEKENRLKGFELNTKTYKGLEMNFELSITPEAKIEVIIDKNTGHSLTSTGYGTMLLEINTLGKFNMWGDYQVQDGKYNFKYGGILDKEFSVKRNGTIIWEGDPTRARLNLEAVYKTQANPSVLLETPTFSRNIPVEVVILLNGNLTNPEPDFTINFPSVSSVLKSDLEYRLSDTDTRQTQALALLATGSFLSPTNANTAVYGSLFERAGTLFNDLFTDDDSKLKLGFNYIPDSRNPYVETNSQVGVTLSSQISDRITVNGQLGVPVGGVNESVIVGNVEVQLRINDDGTLKARVFNRENDINFLGEGIGYTQGVGLTYEVDFDTFKEFVNKVFKTVKIEEATDNNSNDIPDSDLSPEFIKFAESRNKKKTEQEEDAPKPIPEVE